MAESGFDFTVELAVTADMSPFREQLRRGIDEAQKAGATIPVGGTAPGTSGGFVPPAAGGIASATAAAGLPSGSTTVTGPNAAVQLAMNQAAVAQPIRTAASAALQAATLAGLPAPAGGFFGTGAVVGAWGAPSPAAPVGGSPAALPGFIPAVPGGAAGFATSSVSFFGTERERAFGSFAPATTGGFFGAPSGRRMFGLGLFGAHEMIRATRALDRSELSSALAETEQDSIGQRIEGIRAATSGFFGSLGAEAMELAGSPNSPIALERDLTIQAARLRTQQRTSDIRFETERMAGVREGQLSGGNTGEALARVRFDAASARRVIRQQIQERERELSAGHMTSGSRVLDVLIPYMSGGHPEIDRDWKFHYDIEDSGVRGAKQSEISALRRQEEEVNAGERASGSLIRAEASIQRMAYSAQGMNFADAASRQYSPAQLGRRAMLRRHEVALAKARIEDPDSIGTLRSTQQEELGDFDVTAAQNERIGDIDAVWSIRAAASAGANMPSVARRQLAYGKYRAAFVKAEGDTAEQNRLTQVYQAQDKFAVAEETRRRGVEAIQTIGATGALALENARMPFQAGLAGIAGQAAAAIEQVPADNQAQRGRLANLYAQQAVNFAQRYRDRMQLIGMGLAGQERVSGILADPNTPAGERYTGAQAASIAEEANQRATAFEQEGQPQFAAQARRIGVNQLRAAALEFRSRLHVEEIEGINRVDLVSGGSIQRQLGAFRAAERELGGQGGGGAGGGDDAKSFMSEVLGYFRQLIDAVREGAGVGP